MQTVLKMTPSIRHEIVKIVDDRIREAHITREDFSELKAIVRDIAETQKRTESRVEELADAQKKTESRMEELADAQKRTESRMEELADAQKRTEISVGTLAKGLDATRTELGGLARSVSYSLENEAYRQLPQFLKEQYQIELTEKMIRFELDGEEINLFAKGRKGGEDILIVGEAELRLSGVGKLRQLEKKISLVKKLYPVQCLPLIVTHFARPQVLTAAREKGIMVVQSFEW
jgi:chromosome segregation ATPase